MINQLIKEELRSNCNCPKKFQLLDFGGVALGTFFIIDSIRRIKRGENGFAKVELGLGFIMALIHSTRFFYAKELKNASK